MFSQNRMQNIDTAEICQNMSPKTYVNMDGVAVCFEARQKQTAHFKEENTIHTRITESDSLQIMGRVEIASNALKLLSFFS